MNNTIHIPIKKEWFDMILSGKKKEEYRAINKYWAKRLTSVRLTCINSPSCFEKCFSKPGRSLGPYGKETVTLTNGYGKHRPRIVVELLGVEIKNPNPEWCPKDTHGLWFAIKLGKIISKNNI